jgi:heme oxygenase
LDLAGTLKNAIDTLHRRIESTPYARAIFSGSISPRDYARSLVQFLQLHESLEDQFAKHPELPCYDPESMARTVSLQRDIAWWGGFADEQPLPSTANVISTFERWSDATPVGLIGAIYVLEGSRMGSMILAGSLSRGLQVPAEPGMGLDYHVDGITDRPKTWRGFRETLNALELSPEDREIVIASAVETMAILCDLYAELTVSQVRDEVEVPA